MQNYIFAERKYYSCEGKSACQPQRLAHDLLRFAERKDTQSIQLLQTNQEETSIKDIV